MNSKTWLVLRIQIHKSIYSQFQGYVHSPPPENLFIKGEKENLPGDSGRETGSKEGAKPKTTKASAIVKNVGRQGKTPTAEIHRKIPSATKQREQQKSKLETHLGEKKKGPTGALRPEPQKSKPPSGSTEKVKEVVESKDHDLPKSPVEKESDRMQREVKEAQDEAKENDEDEGENEEGEQNKQQEKEE
ncbi:hypothetical protein Y032_0036g3201 [Ancylostoma ceylanicum]|uniref:Uncharacterized protein n=1 Tax=Ancylostoma ceylanicum TaxID=53326 RepID=A0A016UL45_9BILA|nr:hypothetical protein Y032_0036g3201 [Ancylostoma ceylanicum]